MKFAWIEAEKAQFPVEVAVAVLGVSRSGFYAWRKRPKSARSKKRAQLVTEIAATHKKSKRRYGSPRVHRALRNKGITVNHKTVERVMREEGLVGRQKRRFRRPPCEVYSSKEHDA